ncbi:MAG: Protein of unknown function UPF0031:YjeF-related protein, N-terminal [Rhodocyclaceae bacterium]|nr:Protein of unknown function UPF0031:YjeF-related protein, N-terminal [Rhodocyclaceae bacterium]
MTSLYRSTSLRRIETACATQPLMERAGAAAALWAAELAADRNFPVLVLAGPGNNGGDAFEAARLLQERAFDVRLVFAGDPARLPADAQAAHRRFVAAGGTPLGAIPEIPRWGLVLDGLFGIGLARAPAGRHGELITQANVLVRRDRCPCLALDCPSGLDADSGRAFEPAIRASHTLTFIAAKPGLYTADGPDHCGAIRVADLGLVPEEIAAPEGGLVSPALFADRLAPRRRNSHKGTYGSLGILGGAPSMLGAAFLAGRAALKLGTGRVYVGLLDAGGPAFDPVQPELMLRRPEGVLAAGLSALACGPGLGTSQQAGDLLDKALALDLPLVLDADALNLVATEPDLQAALAARPAPTLLTPHPAEAARLLGMETAAIQADRIGKTLEIATRYRSHVALKGCGTVVAAPDGRWWVNTTGNPGMASAGTGDVLTGFAGALLAQGWEADRALLAAVHLHGAAGDGSVAAGRGPIGLTASELIDAARCIFNGWHAAA